jgi:hypothetical protein
MAKIFEKRGVCCVHTEVRDADELAERRIPSAGTVVGRCPARVTSRQGLEDGEGERVERGAEERG